MHYTFSELIWLVLIYSFLGWFIETIVGTIRKKKFVNRGFSSGPFCFIYGTAALIMIISLEDLENQPFFLFLGCMIIATTIEWFAGKILERMNQRKWWDYSDKKWNFDGYICLQYTLLWAVLGVAALRYGNTYFFFLYSLIPEPLRSIIVWGLVIYLALDTLVSFTAVLHLQHGKGPSGREHRKFTVMLFRASRAVIGYVERRMTKAYPLIQERAEEILKEGRFAEGCGFYKLFWLFLIGSLLGDFTETIFCRITAGVWMSRSSLVWGPFSIVWGFAIVLATVLLYKDRDKPDRHIFLIGTLLGGAYEYMCSVMGELVFGQVFWDYSEIPFNLGGRVNLLYCFFWGIAAVVWIKGLYPHVSKWIEKIPKMTGYIASWILIVFMSANMIVSAVALIRYDQRAGGPPAESGWEQIIDTNFDDARMKQIYPNAKFR